ncbi:EamA family transporter [Anseongella ginsenosidimutans]|nr:EamA family transporter [Anseongella ginsenosidimutans]
MWGFFAIPLRNISGYSAGTILYYRIFVSLLLACAAILFFRKKSLMKDRMTIRQLPPGQRRQLTLLVIASVVALIGNWLSFIYVVNQVSLQAAAFAYMVCPIITALFGFLLLKEEISRRKWIAMGVSLISVLILSWGFMTEVAWSVGVALLFAIYLVIQRKISGIDRFNLLAVQLLLASALVLPAFFLQHEAIPAEPRFWVNILIIALLFTVIPLYLNLFALIRIPSSTVGILIYINPIVAFAVAFIYFGDQTSPLQVVSYLVLLCAVVIFNWGNLLKLKRKPH